MTDQAEKPIEGAALALVKAQALTKLIADTTIKEIGNQPTFDFIADTAKKARTIAKDIEDARTSITVPMNVALTATNGIFNPLRDRAKAYVDTCKGLMLAWTKKLERIQLETQRKAEEVARLERQRIEAQAREKREQQEAQAREAEEAIKKAREAKDDEERQRLMKEADGKLKAAENSAAEANAQESVAATVVAPVAPLQAPSARKGFYGVKTYQAILDDKKAFVRWALETGALEYITVDVALLTKEAKATKGVRKWPGIRVTTGEGSRMRG